jgi:peptidoglycan hydrolase-like protein with peptidoglycan-binding domain
MLIRNLVIAAFAISATAAFANTGSKQKSAQASDTQSAIATAPASGDAQPASGNTQDSETVKQAQQALNDKGFKVGKVDGIAGPKTQAAVQKFQQKQGINASGSLDSQTLLALNVSGGQSSASSASSSASPSNDTTTQSAAPTSPSTNQPSNPAANQPTSPATNQPSSPSTNQPPMGQPSTNQAPK